MWHHDVTNARTCQFYAVYLTVFPFEFRPRTFTIGFYGKNSIISELMILECSFPLKVPLLSLLRKRERPVGSLASLLGENNASLAPTSAPWRPLTSTSADPTWIRKRLENWVLQWSKGRLMLEIVDLKGV